MSKSKQLSLFDENQKRLCDCWLQHIKFVKRPKEKQYCFCKK